METNAKVAKYVKIPNVVGLYRQLPSGRYYGQKKVRGKRHEVSLRTEDRKIAERRLKEWVASLDRGNAELERRTLRESLQKFFASRKGKSPSTLYAERCMIKRFERTWPYGLDIEVRSILPSNLDEWLAKRERSVKNTTYNRDAGFLKQLFAIAVKDGIILESPFDKVTTRWKKPQTPVRRVPTIEQFEAIVSYVRAQRFTDHANDSADFIAFLGLAGVGQAEASALTWGDIDWELGRISFRRQKTDTRFYTPIYEHLRPLLLDLQAKAGNPSPNTRVLKIKDAKKALARACTVLGLPHYSQRNIRQCLIMRLWKAGIDKKLIAKWQGHQDGGELILGTYTEVFGSDDDSYERQQLGKLSPPPRKQRTEAVIRAEIRLLLDELRMVQARARQGV